MHSKGAYYAAAVIGSVVGGLIPTLWGAGFLSISSLVIGTIFALLAIGFVYWFFK